MYAQGMRMKRDLSPEARGVLVALASLGKIKHVDDVTLELAKAGLAELHGGHLEINQRGRDLGIDMMGRPRRLAEMWKRRTQRH